MLHTRGTASTFAVLRVATHGWRFRDERLCLRLPGLKKAVNFRDQFEQSLGVRLDTGLLAKLLPAFFRVFAHCNGTSGKSHS